MITVTGACAVTHIIIIPLSVVHLSIVVLLRFTVLGVAGHSEVAVGAIHYRPLVSIVIKVYLGWQSAPCLVIGACPWIGARKVGGILILTTGLEVVTILILVTLTPFVCCPMNGTVVIICTSFPLFLIII